MAVRTTRELPRTASAGRVGKQWLHSAYLCSSTSPISRARDGMQQCSNPRIPDGEHSEQGWGRIAAACRVTGVRASRICAHAYGKASVVGDGRWLSGEAY